MDHAHVVIGAGYGDEGKGLITDALAYQHVAQGKRVCVVRFNGGAQAGHTVQLPCGHRHVFHHFGAGSLAGASTHLGQRFVIQPMLFKEELLALEGKGNICISVDPRALLTLPFDVWINQTVERYRGVARHGSCGVGFGEAVHRNETGQPFHRITIGELADMGAEGLRARWADIAQNYLPARLTQLGVPLSYLNELFDLNATFDRFIQDCIFFLDHASFALPSQIECDVFVLEGAQGLALDEQLGCFPFVTRSKTGLPWALEFLNEIPGCSISATVWYLTRAYTTRHGAGPLAHEGQITLPQFSDPTNQPNEFQGTLRLAPLDVDLLETRIHSDLSRSRFLKGKVNLDIGLSVSCLDQMEGEIPLSDGRIRSSEGFTSWLGLRLGVEKIVQSWGPSRNTLAFSSCTAPPLRSKMST